MTIDEKSHFLYGRKTKKTMRIKKLKIPIYSYRFTLIESADTKEMFEYFKKVDVDFDKREIFAHAVEASRIEKGEHWLCVYIVFNTKNKFMPLTHSTIAHEAKHIADFIFERIGASTFNDEPHNYLTEYIVKAVNEFLGIKDEIK